jgi:hypothetical protein
MCSLPVSIQRDVVSVDEMESADAFLNVHEEVPSIIRNIIGLIFTEKEEETSSQEMEYENYNSDDDGTVSDECII